MEHGYQGRYIEGYELAKEYNLRFVFGAEAYWVKDRTEKDKSNCHIYIGAKNESGRQAINDILSEANITGFYGQPRIDIPLIMSLPRDDVIVTTACVAYWKYDDIEDITKRFADRFQDNFYLEVQYHLTPAQEALNERILRLRESVGSKLIMGCDSHYIHENGAQGRTDYLLSKGIEYPEESGWFLDYPDGDTAYQRFAKQGVLDGAQIDEAMDNTNVFLNVEEYDNPVFTKDIKIVSLYSGLSQEQRNQKYINLIKTQWDKEKRNIAPADIAKYEAAIAEETKTVCDTNTADYFTSNYAIIERGKKNGGRLTKTGRGSAVSYYTNKLLGFTEIDRIAAPVKMYPERFMSTTRILDSHSLPDIDFNTGNVAPFALAQKQVLGEDHAYPMLAYGTNKISSAWKLYAKSQGIQFDVANNVSEQISKYETALKHADEDSKGDIDVLDYIEPTYRNVFAGSEKYRGTVSSFSIAPSAYLLYQGSIRKEVGLIRIKDNLCCLMDGLWAEKYHFLKNDLLKVSVYDLIYGVYDRLGIEADSVSDLIKKCSEDRMTWDIYAKGCTLCVNQCEQTGTASRVAKYKPKNSSEICAFVAAIRPGFKSMYKTFEERTPFKYGVKAFDDLIQTKEMPNSFVLYQEQEMAALHYAGIDMSDCYTAIKNIAKKRAEKVFAYKEKFITGFSNVMINEEHKSEGDAAALSNKLWQIVEDSARYSFNASHAYCVGIDSMYCAYLKSHYPLEFYETALRIQANKGDKDKMVGLKNEATEYFGIDFPPFKFGQDNRQIKLVKENNSITNSLVAIKGFGKTVGEKLYTAGQKEYSCFTDILLALDKVSIKEATVLPLIKISYFSEFGNQRELCKILNLFNFFNCGEAKNIKKELVPDWMQDIIPQYATDTGVNGNQLKSWSIKDCVGLMKQCEADILSLHLPELDFKVAIQNELDILGYISITTHAPEDRRKLIVSSVIPIKSNKDGEIWCYRLETRSIGTGKTARTTIKASTYNRTPIMKGDIILANQMEKNKSGYWYILNYNKIA